MLEFARLLDVVVMPWYSELDPTFVGTIVGALIGALIGGVVGALYYFFKKR